VDARIDVFLSADRSSPFMTRRLIPCLCVLLVALAAVVPPESPAQQREDLPEEVQRELEERGMTVQEARQRMQQLGIDPSNPQQAAQRARELGVPEARIQSLLRAAGALQAGQAQRGEIQAEAPVQPPPAPSSPFLAGTPVVRPGSLSVGQLPVAVEVQVPLRSQRRIQRVQPLLRTARGDSARARKPRSRYQSRRHVAGNHYHSVRHP
jgi:polysaccharide export outer membrane protein